MRSEIIIYFGNNFPFKNQVSINTITLQTKKYRITKLIQKNKNIISKWPTPLVGSVQYFKIGHSYLPAMLLGLCFTWLVTVHTSIYKHARSATLLSSPISTVALLYFTRKRCRPVSYIQPTGCQVKRLAVRLNAKCNALYFSATAPSGAHTEPWKFILIQDPETKAAIRDIIEEEEYLNYSKRMSRQWVTDLKPFRTIHIKEYLSEAPALVLVFRQTYSYTCKGQKRMHYYSEISVPTAAGILLAAIQVFYNNLLTKKQRSVFETKLKRVVDRHKEWFSSGDWEM